MSLYGSYLPKVLDPTLLFFAFGMFAGLVRSNLEIPAQASKMLAQLLLIALGLKSAQPSPARTSGLGCALFLATAIPVLGYLSLRRLLPRFEAIALAASFGSVSAVAFIAATQRLEDAGLNFGGYMSAAMAIMESPAIVLAVVAAGFARHAAGGPHASVRPGRILHESLTDGAQLLLLGAMLVGILSGENGQKMMAPFSVDLFKGMLAFFLLDMGLTAARNFPLLKGQSPMLLACHARALGSQRGRFVARLLAQFILGRLLPAHGFGRKCFLHCRSGSLETGHS